MGGRNKYGKFLLFPDIWNRANGRPSKSRIHSAYFTMITKSRNCNAEARMVLGILMGMIVAACTLNSIRFLDASFLLPYNTEHEQLQQSL